MNFKRLSKNNGALSLPPEKILLNNWDAFLDKKDQTFSASDLDDAPSTIKKLLNIISAPALTAVRKPPPDQPVEAVQKAPDSPILDIKGSLLPYLLDPDHHPLPHDVDVKIVCADEAQSSEILTEIFKEFRGTPGFSGPKTFRDGDFVVLTFQLNSVELELICGERSTHEKSPLYDFNHNSLSLRLEKVAVEIKGVPTIQVINKDLSSMAGEDKLPNALDCICRKIGIPSEDNLRLIRIVKANISGYHPLDPQAHEAAYDRFSKDISTNPNSATSSQQNVSNFITKLYKDYGHDTPPKRSADNPIIIGLTALFSMMISAKKTNSSFPLPDIFTKVLRSLNRKEVNKGNRDQAEPFWIHLSSLMDVPRDTLNFKVETLDQGFTLGRQLLALYHSHKLQEEGVEVDAQLTHCSKPFLGDNEQQQALIDTWLNAQHLMGEHHLTHPPISEILAYLTAKSELDFFPKLQTSMALEQKTHDVAFNHFAAKLSQTPIAPEDELGAYTLQLLRDSDTDSPPQDPSSASPIIIGLTRLFSMMLRATKLNDTYPLDAAFKKVKTLISDPTIDKTLSEEAMTLWTQLEPVLEDTENETALHEGVALGQQLLRLYHSYKLQDAGLNADFHIEGSAKPFTIDQARQKLLLQEFLQAQVLMGDHDLTHPPLSEILAYLTEKSDLTFFSELQTSLALEKVTHEVAFSTFSLSISKCSPSRRQDMISTFIQQLCHDTSQAVLPEDPSADPPIIMGLKRLFSMLIEAKTTTPSFPLYVVLDVVKASLKHELPDSDLSSQALKFWTCLEFPLLEEKFTTIHQGLTLSRQLFELYHAYTLEGSQISAKSQPFIGNSKEKKKKAKAVLEAQKFLGSDLSAPPFSTIIDFFIKKNPDGICKKLKTEIQKAAIPTSSSQTKPVSPEESGGGGGSAGSSSSTEGSAAPSQVLPTQEKAPEPPPEGIALLPFVFKQCVAILKEESGLATVIKVEKGKTFKWSVTSVCKIFEKQVDKLSLKTVLGIRKLLSDHSASFKALYSKKKGESVGKKKKKKNKKGSDADQINKETLAEHRRIFEKQGLVALLKTLEVEANARIQYPDLPEKLEFSRTPITTSEFQKKYELLCNYSDKLDLCEKFGFEPPEEDKRNTQELAKIFNTSIRSDLLRFLVTQTKKSLIEQTTILGELFRENHHDLWSYNPETTQHDFGPESIVTISLKIVWAIRQYRMLRTKECLTLLQKSLEPFQKFFETFQRPIPEFLYEYTATLLGWVICHAPLSIGAHLYQKCLTPLSTGGTFKEYMPPTYRAVLDSKSSPYLPDISIKAPEQAQEKPTKQAPSQILTPNESTLLTLDIPAINLIISSVEEDPILVINTLRRLMTTKALTHFTEMSGITLDTKETYTAFKIFNSMLPKHDNAAPRLSNEQIFRNLTQEATKLPDLSQPFCDNFLSACMEDFQEEYMHTTSQQPEQELSSQEICKAQRLCIIIKRYADQGQSLAQQEALALLPILHLFTTKKSDSAITETMTALDAFQEQDVKTQCPRPYFHLFIIKIMERPLYRCMQEWNTESDDRFLHINHQTNKEFVDLINKALTVLPQEVLIDQLKKPYIRIPLPNSNSHTCALNIYQLLHKTRSLFTLLLEGGQQFKSHNDFNNYMTVLSQGRFVGDFGLHKKIIVAQILRDYPQPPGQVQVVDISKLDAEKQQFLIQMISSFEPKPSLDSDNSAMRSTYTVWRTSYLTVLDSLTREISDQDRAKTSYSHFNHPQTFQRHGRAAQKMVADVSKMVVEHQKELGQISATQDSISAALSGIWMDLCDLIAHPNLLLSNISQISWALDHLIHRECPGLKQSVAEKFLGLFLNAIYIDQNNKKILSVLGGLASHFGCALPKTSIIDTPHLDSLTHEIQCIHTQMSLPKDLNTIISLLKKTTHLFPTLAKKQQDHLATLLKDKLTVDLGDLFQKWPLEESTMIDPDTFSQLDFQLHQMNEYLSDGSPLITTPLRYMAAQHVTTPGDSQQCYLSLVPAELPCNVYQDYRTEMNDSHLQHYKFMLIDIERYTQKKLKTESDSTCSEDGGGRKGVEASQLIATLKSKPKLDEMSPSEFTETYQMLLTFLSQDGSQDPFLTEYLAAQQLLIRQSYPLLVATSGCHDSIDRVSVLNQLLTYNHATLWDAAPELPELPTDATDDTSLFLHRLCSTISEVINNSRTWGEDSDQNQALSDCIEKIEYLEREEEKTYAQAALLGWAFLHLPQNASKKLFEHFNKELRWRYVLPKPYLQFIGKKLRLERNNPEITFKTRPVPDTISALKEYHRHSPRTLNPFFMIPKRIEHFKTFLRLEAHIQKSILGQASLKSIIEFLPEIDQQRSGALASAFGQVEDLLTKKTHPKLDFPDLQQPYLDRFITLVLLDCQMDDPFFYTNERNEAAIQNTMMWNRVLKKVLAHYTPACTSRIQQEANIFLRLLELTTDSRLNNAEFIKEALQELDTIQDWFNQGNKFNFHHFAFKIYSHFLKRCMSALSEHIPHQHILFINERVHQQGTRLIPLALSHLDEEILKVYQTRPLKILPGEKGEKIFERNIFRQTELQVFNLEGMLYPDSFCKDIDSFSRHLDIVIKNKSGEMQVFYEKNILLPCLKDFKLLSQTPQLNAKQQNYLLGLLKRGTPQFDDCKSPMMSTFVIWQISTETFLKHATLISPKDQLKVKMENCVLQKILESHSDKATIEMKVAECVDASSEVSEAPTHLAHSLTAILLDFCNLCDDAEQIPEKLSLISWALDHLLYGLDDAGKGKLIETLQPWIAEKLPADILSSLDQETLSRLKAFAEHFKFSLPLATASQGSSGATATTKDSGPK